MANSVVYIHNNSNNEPTLSKRKWVPAVLLKLGGGGGASQKLFRRHAPISSPKLSTKFPRRCAFHQCHRWEIAVWRISTTLANYIINRAVKMMKNGQNVLTCTGNINVAAWCHFSYNLFAMFQIVFYCYCTCWLTYIYYHYLVCRVAVGQPTRQKFAPSRLRVPVTDRLVLMLVVLSVSVCSWCNWCECEDGHVWFSIAESEDCEVQKYAYGGNEDCVVAFFLLLTEYSLTPLWEKYMISEAALIANRLTDGA